MRTVTFEELEPWVLVSDGQLTYLITGINPCDEFFDGKPSISYLLVVEAYYGQTTGMADTEKRWTVVHERGTPEYEQVLRDILKQRQECLEDAEADCMWIEDCLLPHSNQN
jgi:hypothetical protein